MGSTCLRRNSVYRSETPSLLAHVWVLDRLIGMWLGDESVVSRFESTNACLAALTPGAFGVVGGAYQVHR
jgi:hypothetical protein